MRARAAILLATQDLAGGGREEGSEGYRPDSCSSPGVKVWVREGWQGCGGCVEVGRAYYSKTKGGSRSVSSLGPSLIPQEEALRVKCDDPGTCGAGAQSSISGRPLCQFLAGLLVPPPMSPEPAGTSACSGYGATLNPLPVTCKGLGVSGHWAGADTHGLRFWNCLNRLCWAWFIINVLSHHKSPPSGADAGGPGMNICYIFHEAHEEGGSRLTPFIPSGSF